jgi:hypothetical protein
VTTGTASGATQTAATLTGAVNPNGSALTDCRFDYGTSSAHGASVPCAQGVTGSTPVNVSAAMRGLAPGTSYHYRLVAANAGGTTTGGDQTFTTASVVHPPPCAGLHGAKLKRYTARQTYLQSLAACYREYHGTGKSVKTRRATCRRKATTAYHRALALVR